MNFLDFDENIVFLSFKMKNKSYDKKIYINEKDIFLWL